MPLKWILDRLRGKKRTVSAPLLAEKAQEILESERNPTNNTIHAAAVVHHVTRGFGTFFSGGCGS